jgi:hypothetical protein
MFYSYQFFTSRGVRSWKATSERTFNTRFTKFLNTRLNLMELSGRGGVSQVYILLCLTSYIFSQCTKCAFRSRKANKNAREIITCTRCAMLSLFRIYVRRVIAARPSMCAHNGGSESVHAYIITLITDIDTHKLSIWPRQ